jgi:predicted permease
MKTLQDLRYGVRMMLRNPGFAAVAILSLALGIGANTSIFSIINATLLSPPPFKEPDRLMMVQRLDAAAGQEAPSYWSYPKFEILRQTGEAFEQVAAFSNQNFPLTDTDSPERLQVEVVSASYFPLLGVEAYKGRVFAPEEDQTPGKHPVALIGHGLWQRRFGSDAGVIGQTISLNKVPFTVVGVLPEGFKGQVDTAEVWVPMMMAPALTFPRRLAAPHAHWHQVIARLRQGVSQAEAQDEADAIAARIAEALPARGAQQAEAIKVTSLAEARVDPAIRKSFLILLVAVGAVLLIACMNVASLLLAKAVSRQKEIAIRLALGASRPRLIRQLLTESMLLGCIGGAGGLLMALWTIEALGPLKPANAQASIYLRALDFSSAQVDGQVLAFNIALSLLTGALFGIIPAIQASRPDINETLKEGGDNSASTLRSLRRVSSRNLLVVGEIAIALVLLTCAGLMIRSFARLQAIQTGFEPDGLLTLKVQLPKYSESAAAGFYEQLLARVSALGGVESATVASSTPLSSNSSGALMKVEGRPDQMSAVGLHSVGPDHFKTLRIPLVKGRPFADYDRAGSKRVAIVSEAAAGQFWPGEDPIGKRVHLSVGWEPTEFAEVVGVVGDVKYKKIEQPAEPDVYLPYLQPTEDPAFVIVRTEESPASLVAALRREVLALDRNVPLFDIKTMKERTAAATSRTRFSALLLAIMAGLALLLAVTGIYGVMAFAVSGRTREIGIRMALGAQHKDVLRMVMLDGVVLTAAGLVIGLGAALFATRALGSQLYGVGTTDPVTFAAVSLVLALVALVACYVPARRATRVDPTVALRYE